MPDEAANRIRFSTNDIIYSKSKPFSKIDRSMQERLDTLFSSYFTSSEPGGAVLLVKDDQIIYKNAWGIADIQAGKPITSATLFNIGSITKTIVAYGILQLAAQNKLSVEDNLLNYFPDFKNKSIGKKVKIIHLLTHSSGLPDNRKIEEEREFYLSAKDEENWAPLLQTDNLSFEPGTNYTYSNPAFNALALIIEKLSGQPWQAYIKEKIFVPSGMFFSDITDGAHPETGVAHAYIKNENTDFIELDYGEEPTFAAAGNGGVWSNVEELWKYEQALQKTTFLPESWIKKSREVYNFPEWAATHPSRLGLSWFLTKEMNHPLIGHTGSQGGFISDYCWLPKQKVFYVLLCNTPKPIIEIRQKVLEAIGIK